MAQAGLLPNLSWAQAGSPHDLEIQEVWEAGSQDNTGLYHVPFLLD